MKLTVSPSFNKLLTMATCLAVTRFSSAEKLSSDLQAPLFAQGAGGLRLDPPYEGPVKTYASILKQTNNPNIGDGQYSFSYETEDGVQREEVGKLKKVGKELVTVVEGRYSYTSPEGLAIDVKYSADENGARSSFTFGTNPGKWRQSLSLPGSLGSIGDKGKFVSSITTSSRLGEDTGRGYLPPSNKPAKEIVTNNEYLPPDAGPSSSFSAR